MIKKRNRGLRGVGVMMISTGKFHWVSGPHLHAAGRPRGAPRTRRRTPRRAPARERPPPACTRGATARRSGNAPAGPRPPAPRPIRRGRRRAAGGPSGPLAAGQLGAVGVLRDGALAVFVSNAFIEIVRARDFGATGIRDYAKGTKFIATFLNCNKF